MEQKIENQINVISDISSIAENVSEVRTPFSSTVLALREEGLEEVEIEATKFEMFLEEDKKTVDTIIKNYYAAKGLFYENYTYDFFKTTLCINNIEKHKIFSKQCLESSAFQNYFEIYNEFLAFLNVDKSTNTKLSVENKNNSTFINKLKENEKMFLEIDIGLFSIDIKTSMSRLKFLVQNFKILNALKELTNNFNDSDIERLTIVSELTLDISNTYAEKNHQLIKLASFLLAMNEDKTKKEIFILQLLSNHSYQKYKKTLDINGKFLNEFTAKLNELAQIKGKKIAFCYDFLSLDSLTEGKKRMKYENDIIRIEAQRVKDKEEFEAQRLIDKEEFEAQRLIDKEEFEAQRLIDKAEYEAQRMKDKAEYEAQRMKDKAEFKRLLMEAIANSQNN